MRVPIGTVLTHTRKNITWKILRYQNNNVVCEFMGGIETGWIIGREYTFSMDNEINLLLVGAPNEEWVLAKSCNFQSLYNKLL